MAKYITLFLVLIFNVETCNAQQKKVLLKSVITDIEKKFDVRFSSASNDVKNIKISPPKNALSLKEFIEYFNANTSLNFSFLTGRYITIQKKKPPKIEVLNPVIITQYLTKGIQKRKDGSIVLNSKNFGILPGLSDPDVIQVLQTLPGVNSSNESLNYLNVRGGTNDQNLVLWNEIKMYHSAHFFGLISAYNPFFITRTQVTKNGTSSLYSDGVSGTIKMFTDDEINEETSGSFGMNLINQDAYIKIPVSEKLAIHLSGRRSFTDYIQTKTYRNFIEKSLQNSDLNVGLNNNETDFYFYDYTAKLLYNVNQKNKIRINFININNQLNYREPDTNQSFKKTSNLSQDKLGLGVSWNSKWNSKFSSLFNFYHSNYNINTFDDRITVNQILQQKNTVTENNIRLNNIYKYNTKIALKFGLQINETGILNTTLVNNPKFKSIQKEVLITSALFSEIEYNFKKTYIKTGVRINHIDKFNKLILEPRINYNYKLNRFLSFHIMAEFKHQSASQIIDFNDNFLGVENRRWVLANGEEYKVIKSKQLDVGLTYKRDNYLLEINPFFKQINNINTQSQGFQNQFKFISKIGNYRVNGIELLVNKTYKNYSTWLSYTFSKNTYNFDNLNPSEFANNVDVRHIANLVFSYTFAKKIEFSMGVLYKTGNNFTELNRNNNVIEQNGSSVLNFNQPNSNVLSHFFRIDSSLKYNFSLSENITGALNLGIANIFNQQKTANQNYLIANDKILNIKDTSLKLTPNFGMRLFFN
ncbi:TonB-dependent receptor plug domain-containing protein [Wenyingzhuangia sp. IMCC45533]